LPLSPVEDIVSDSPSMEAVLPFLRLVYNEPSTNFRAGSIADNETEQELYSQVQDNHSITSSEPSSKKGKQRMAGLVKFLVAPTKPKPSAIHGLNDRVWDEDDGSFSCFLWERSLFYTKARVDKRAWQLRWFTFRRQGITSLPNRTFCKDEMRYPDFVQIDVDEAHLILKMYIPGAQTRDCKKWVCLQ